MAITVYTDGSRIGGNYVHKGGPGGCAYVMIDNDGNVTEYAVGYFKTTNNRQEFLAVIMALESLSRREFVHIYTDSEYVIKTMTSWAYRWRKRHWKTASQEPVKNVDLIIRLQKLMMFHRVQFTWVKGHSGIEYNERCDKLARDAARHPTETDAGYLLALAR